MTIDSVKQGDQNLDRGLKVKPIEFQKVFCDYFILLNFIGTQLSVMH